MMVTARKYHLHFHTIMLSFRSKIPSIYMEIPFNLDITQIKTRQNVIPRPYVYVTGRREGRSTTDPNQPSSAPGGLSAHLELVLKAENQSRWRL